MNTNGENEIIMQPALATGTKEFFTNSEPVSETIVIYDECGNTLWDAVLEQEYPALKHADVIF